ncbi:ABC transporter permease [Bryobacter aggregatus]|uniref:ABC transporter permease n=1 Tax=Bryobacter aggregatus TaxID=360054 RepID=UPI0004E106FC|nr:ABC transporter permease [Bryobacter aggregatus]
MLPLHCYRTLLLCYPKPFRAEYGAEMLAAFSEQIQQARRRRSLRAELSIWFFTLLDLIQTAPQEHLHVISQDLRYAARNLATTPGFTTVAIASLALGIGANLAIFSLLNSVLLSSLPVRNPQELVMLTNPGSAGRSTGSQRGERSLLTYGEFLQQREQSQIFSKLMAAQSYSERISVRIDGAPAEDVRSQMVSGDYFSGLGIDASIGRTLSDVDTNTIGAAPYAVLSHSFWERRFERSSAVLGKPIALRGGIFTIIGVAPPGFFGDSVGQHPDVWLPLTMQTVILPGTDRLRDLPGDIDKVMWLHVYGRLQPGQNLARAEAAANAIFQQGLIRYYNVGLSPENLKKFLDQRLKLRSAASGASQTREQFANPLTMLLAAAGVVLLIACANLGNLLLARVVARNREISVRLALGASRSRLVRQLLTESMFLAFLGGCAGVATAILMRMGLVHLVSESTVISAAIDARLIGFAFGLTVITGLALGLLPALRVTRMDNAAGLKEQGRGVSGSLAWQRVGRLVVVGQLALSLPLLIGAGLLLRTLNKLQSVDLGYQQERLFSVSVDAQTAGYAEALRPALFTDLSERIRAVPGVKAVTFSGNGLFTGSDSGDEIVVEGYEKKGNESIGSRYDHVGPNYFSTVGIPMLQGREISDRDTPAGNKVCVINESFAKRFFEGRNPLGLHVTQVYGKQRNTYEVIGLSHISRSNSLRREEGPRFYVPAAQPVTPLGVATYVIHTPGDPALLTEPIRRAILARDPNLPLIAPRPLARSIDEYVITERMLAKLSFAFGLVALLLAAIGLYGVLSYGVTRRTSEIGLRKALGAQQSEVLSMILRETCVLLAVGLGLGVLLSYAGMKAITSQLYGLAPTDPLAFAAATGILVLVAILATAIPALRAARVDPLVALRYE